MPLHFSAPDKTKYSCFFLSLCSPADNVHDLFLSCHVSAGNKSLLFYHTLVPFSTKHTIFYVFLRFFYPFFTFFITQSSRTRFFHPAHPAGGFLSHRTKFPVISCDTKNPCMESLPHRGSFQTGQRAQSSGSENVCQSRPEARAGLTRES